MPQIDVRPFKPESNVDIINAIRKNASPDYQRRVPEASKGALQDNLLHLTEFRPRWNEFVDNLINRIGLVIAKNNTWSNPYSKFKRGMMQMGDTIEEINVGLIKARVYNSDRLNLERDIFGQYPPDVQSSFHKITRQEYYAVTVNEPMLKRAFITEGDLGNFITSVMQAPTTSDQWDEFLQMCSLFRQYHDAGGFFKVHVDDLDDNTITEDERTTRAKDFLRLVRGFAGTLSFLSTHYNAAGMPVAVRPDELELFITPEALAAIDVDALAGAFNIEKAQMPGKINVIPAEQFNIPGAQAILTTPEFFVVADTLLDTTNQWNPVGLTNNYFFHHHEIISASRFVPALLFTTEAGDVITIPETPVVEMGTLTVTNEEGTTVTNVLRGSLYQLIGEAVTDPAGGDNDNVRLELVGNDSTHSYITSAGVIHVAPDEDSGTLTVNAYAIDSEPPQITGTVTVNVVGTKTTLWPNPHVDVDTDDDNIFEATPAELTMDAATGHVDIPTVDNIEYKETITGVTFTDVGDLVGITAHGLPAGAKVSFAGITTTTGIVNGTDYFVINPTANNFQVATTLGGAALPLTTNGTATSATAHLVDGTTVTVPAASTRVFSAVAINAHELTPGATASWSFTRP